MATKLQSVRIFVRIEQLDEEGNAFSKPMVLSKTIECDLHSKTDYFLAAAAQGAAPGDNDADITAPTGNVTNAIVNPLLVAMQAPEGETVAVTPTAGTFYCNFFMAVSLDDTDTLINSLAITNPDWGPGETNYDINPTVLVSGETA